jgi:hypothetical protein
LLQVPIQSPNADVAVQLIIFGLDTWLLYDDLNVIKPGGNMPQLHANLTKNVSVPDVTGGALWADNVNKLFYLFGGEYAPDSTPYSFSPWFYDVVYNTWNTTTPPNTLINRVSYGASVGVSELGKGFYYGGWLSNQSVPGWSAPPMLTANLIMYDYDLNRWSNNSGPDSVARGEGVMVYLPASDGGLLVYFGGVQDVWGNGTVTGVPMSEIHIYDIANEKWYTQTATGTVPEMRRRFCAGATWASDQSSYNMLVIPQRSAKAVTE